MAVTDIASDLVGQAPKDRARSDGVAIGIALAVWLGAASLVSSAGLLSGSGLLFSLYVAVSIAGPIILYARSPRLRAWFATLGLRALSLFHVWRVSAALVFFWYGAEGLLPATFVRNAAWGDLASGILLAMVALFAARPRSFWIAHGIGLADFVVAVGTGMLLTVGEVPAIDNLRDFPIALIPLVLVPLSALTHVAAFDLLRRGVQP